MEERRARRAKFIRLGILGVVVLGILILVGRGAYAKTSRVRECAELAREVNPVLDEIQRLTKAKRDGVTYRRVAQHYSALSLALPKLSKPSLSREVKEYADVLAATAKAVTAGANALDGQNNVLVDQAKRDLERQLRRERTALAKIDAYCRAN